MNWSEVFRVGLAVPGTESGSDGSDPRAVSLPPRCTCLATPVGDAVEGREKLPAVGVGFVGRARELAVARELVGEGRTGSGQMLLLAGEPGIGKSRLLEEIAAVASDEGFRVAWGRCWEAGGAPPYWPWTEALRSLVREFDPAVLSDRLGRDAREVAVVVPDLGDGLVTPSDSPAEDAGARFRLYEGVARLLEVVSEPAPVMLIIDDVHVADPSSLLLLDFVANRLAGVPLVVVAAYRDSELFDEHPFTPALAQFLRAARTTRLTLAGLDQREVGELIHETSGVAPAPSVALRVLEQTDGNPLYVGEVARLLATDVSLVTDGRPLMPRDVRETILARVARLPERARDALAIAAVLGREFAVDVLVGLTSPEILDDLEEAARAQLIAPAPTLGRLRFSHAVIAQALYETLPPAQRMQLHISAARALERRHVGDIESVMSSLALHYAAAVPLAEPRVAADYARRAGDRAMGQLAYEEAARLYGLAASALDADPTMDAAARIDLALAVGEAHVRGGDGAAAKASFLHAADLARGVGDADRLARAALGYGGRFVWMRRGDDDRIVPLLEEALAAVPYGTELWIRLAARLSGALRDDADPARRSRLSAEMLTAARALGDADVLTLACTARFTAIWAPDTTDEMIRLIAEAERHAPAANPDRVAEVAWLRFLSQMLVGDITNLREEMQRYVALGEALRQPSHQWYGRVMRDIVRLIEGPLPGLEAELAETFRVGQIAQSWDAEVSHMLALLRLRYEEDRLGECEPMVRDAVRRFPTYHLLRAIHVLAVAHTGRVDDAQATLRELADRDLSAIAFDNGWIIALQYLAETAVEVADQDVATVLHDKLLPYAQLVGQASGEVIAGSVHLHLGMLAQLLGRSDDARAQYEAALAKHRQMGARIHVAHTLVRFASLVLTTGPATEADRAAAMVAEATALADNLGLAAVRRRLDHLAPVKHSGSPLTPRETDVARLVAQGMTNRQIATAMFVSERTAETHVQRILTKLGFSSRAQIAAWAAGGHLSRGGGPST